MTKKELIARIADFKGSSKASAELALGSVVDTIKEELETGFGVVSIVGFGTFKTVTRPARAGRNPATGKPIQIDERRVVTFKPSKNLIS